MFFLVFGEIRKVKILKIDDKGINSGIKRGCLEQFGFRNKVGVLKKLKKEDLFSIMSGFRGE